jgi:hypothetical protein
MTPLYYTWRNMIQRCTNHKHTAFHRYGGRGITVYFPWQVSEKKFYEYVSTLPNFGKRYYTLDRINNDKGYQPGNLRWVTMADQNKNRCNSPDPNRMQKAVDNLFKIS